MDKAQMNQTYSDLGQLYFDTYEEAAEAARGLRSSSHFEGGMIARVSRSPYGGWRVIALPAEVYADLYTEGLGNEGIGLPKIKGQYGKIPA